MGLVDSKTITVHFERQLYDKIKTYDLQTSDLIRKGVRQYFRSKEDKQKLDGEQLGYNRELLEILKVQLEDLKQDKYQLQQRTYYLSLPFFQRLLLPMYKKQKRMGCIWMAIRS